MSPTAGLRSIPGGHPPSPPGALILSVDLGTSGAKVGLVSPAGDVVAAAFEPTSLVLLPGGGAEQDPDDWWRAVTAAARTVIRATGRASDVVAVACTAQWSGTVALDENGRHLAPALIWMDMRGAPLVRERIGGRIRMAGYEIRKAFHWIRLTGGAPEKSGKGPVGHILWLAREQPEVYQAAAVFLEPKDYLNARLTGRPAAGFDSIALHWVTDNRHVDQVSYDSRLIELAGLDRAKLPELRPPTDVLGPLLKGPATELGVREGLPVVMGAPDMHTAAIGSGATADYQAHLHLGTSSWLVCHTPFKKTDVRRNMTCLPSALPGRSTSLLMPSRRTCTQATTGPPPRQQPAIQVCCSRRGSMASARRWRTRGSGLHSSTSRSTPPGATWCARFSRVLPSTRDGCTAASKRSSVAPSAKSGWSVAGRGRACGARSTPMSSAAPSIRSATRHGPTFVEPRSLAT
jgi:hypothetical protein